MIPLILTTIGFTALLFLYTNFLKSALIGSFMSFGFMCIVWYFENIPYVRIGALEYILIVFMELVVLLCICNQCDYVKEQRIRTKELDDYYKKNGYPTFNLTAIIDRN